MNNIMSGLHAVYMAYNVLYYTYVARN